MNRFFTFVSAVAVAASGFSTYASEASDAIFAEYLSDPANGADIESFSWLRIGFPKAINVTDNSDFPEYECVLTNETTGNVWDLKSSSISDALTGSDKNGFRFIFQYGAITEKGNYTIAFPEGAFLWNDNKSPAFDIHFSIGMGGGETPVEPSDPEDKDSGVLGTWTASPADGSHSDDLRKVVIEFPELGDMYLFGPMDGKGVSLVSSKGSNYSAEAFAPDYKYIQVDINSLLLDGVYTLTLDKGLFILNEDDPYYMDREIPSPEIKLTYYVGDAVGVAALEGEDALFTVHDMGGREVLKAVPAETLRSLEPGLYLINGRTVILRK